MICIEDSQFTRDYHDPSKRSIANALTVEFSDGELDEVRVDIRSVTDCAARKAFRYLKPNSETTLRVFFQRSSRSG